MLVMANPLGAKGVAAEAAIARLCLEGLPALELFERAAVPLRRAVPYNAGCWKTVDPADPAVHQLRDRGRADGDACCGPLAVH